jgi:hypothetical protein
MLSFVFAFVLIVLATTLVVSRVLATRQSLRGMLAWLLLLMAMMVGFGIWLGDLMNVQIL